MSQLWSVTCHMGSHSVNKGKKVNICYSAASRLSHRRGAQVHGAHQAASHIPALLPKRSRYSFTDHLRVEVWVSPGPRCKEQLVHCCYATARSQWGPNPWPSDRWPLGYRVTCYPTQVNAPRLHPSQSGQYSIYLPRRDRVDLGDLLHTEMVYRPQTATHPSTNWARCRLTSLIKPTPLTTTLHSHVTHMAAQIHSISP